MNVCTTLASCRRPLGKFIFVPFCSGIRRDEEKETHNMGASLLSFVPTYMTNGHHRKDGKCFEGKEPIDFVTRTEATGVSRLSGGDFFEPQRR